MAIVECNDEKIEVQNGNSIKDACMELGVPFACENGVCATCTVEIVEGAKNLDELGKREIEMDKDKVHRLACQAKIKQGTVKIKF